MSFPTEGVGSSLCNAADPSCSASHHAAGSSVLLHRFTNTDRISTRAGKLEHGGLWLPMPALGLHAGLSCVPSKFSNGMHHSGSRVG